MKNYQVHIIMLILYLGKLRFKESYLTKSYKHVFTSTEVKW